MKIGFIAKQAGVNVETVRYYQRRGLIEKPDPSSGTYRRYTPEVINRILFIKRTQALGFSLNEISDLLKVSSTHGCKEIQRIIQEKIKNLQDQVHTLHQNLQVLEQLSNKTPSSLSCDSCPLRETSCLPSRIKSTLDSKQAC